MNTVVEDIEIKKNSFSKGLYLALGFLSFAALLISLKEPGNSKWISLAGLLLFGSGYWMALKAKITIAYNGFTVHSVGKPKFVAWKDIIALDYSSHYHGHGVEMRLSISYGSPTKKIELPVKQYNKQKMQRFFEILHAQCSFAIKNDHFIKQATGQMNWKEKLKMY
jgi:hypothetical protein